jgi:hypothetical protein
LLSHKKEKRAAALPLKRLGAKYNCLPVLVAQRQADVIAAE